MSDTPQTLYGFQAQRIDGTPVDLSEFAGKVLLIVNTASACGFTPQLAGLQKLHEKFSARGFEVLGFPCNQFASQDRGSNAQIAQFCETRYSVSFPMMSKIEVNGAGAHPLWAWLKAQAPGVLGSQAIKWNFTKFLIGKDGRAIHRYATISTPASIERDIEAALSAS
jgi:glutathione peroxidase